MTDSDLRKGIALWLLALNAIVYLFLSVITFTNGHESFAWLSFGLGLLALVIMLVVDEMS